MIGRALRAAALLAAALAASACTNDPYPAADGLEKILYQPFDDPPKTLDPQVAYSVVDHMVIGYVYDTLLGYDYLKRPFTLIPGMEAGLGAIARRASHGCPRGRDRGTGHRHLQHRRGQLRESGAGRQQGGQYQRRDEDRAEWGGAGRDHSLALCQVDASARPHGIAARGSTRANGVCKRATTLTVS